jgi:predicted O-methyltransferase YrrM
MCGAGFVRVLLRVFYARATGRSLTRKITPARLKSTHMPVWREAGRLLYVLARAPDARRIVAFGTPFGISTLYLGAAARDNGGEVVTTAIEPSKCRAAVENIRQAGLGSTVRLLPGSRCKR